MNRRSGSRRSRLPVLYYETQTTPTVVSVSPSHGANAGGTTVTITVVSSAGITAATLGGVALTSITITGAYTITGVTGAHAQGNVAATVTNSVGTSASAGSYDYCDITSVTAISPTHGSSSGANHVVIQVGNALTATGATLGGNALTSFAIDDGTHVSGTVAAHVVGTGLTATVTNPAGTSAAGGTYDFIGPMTLVSIVPAYGSSAGGDPVTITVDNTESATSATIGGVAVTSFVVASPTTITCVTGAHAAGTGLTVQVQNDWGGSAGLNYEFQDPTTVSAVSPLFGDAAGGTSVTLTVADSTHAVSAKIGGVSLTSFTIGNSTHVSGVTGAHASGTGLTATVTNAGGASAGGGTYEYQAATTVSAISPASGSTAGGTAVTITVADSTHAVSATVGGVAVTSFAIATPTTVTGVTGAHAAGSGLTATVSNAGGASAGGGTYAYASPFDPAARNLTLWLSGEDFNPTLGTWQSKASTGTSGTPLLVSAPGIRPTAGATQNSLGMPQFTAAGGQYFTSSTTLTNLIGSNTTITVMALVYLDTVNTSAAPAYNSPAILVDSNGALSLNLGNTDKVMGYTESPTATATTSSLSSGAWAFVAMRHTGGGAGTIESKLNNGSWTSVASVGNPTLSGTIKVGTNYNSGLGKFLNGRVAEIFAEPAATSNADVDSYRAWLNTKWGVSI